MLSKQLIGILNGTDGGILTVFIVFALCYKEAAFCLVFNVKGYLALTHLPPFKKQCLVRFETPKFYFFTVFH